MYNRNFMMFLKNLVITGNIALIIWVLYNATHEGFNGTLIETVSYIVLIGLLIVNSILLIKGKQK